MKRALRKVAVLIGEHREELFAPNVMVRVGKRRMVKMLPRTNAPEEGEFRNARRHSRRIRGTNNIERQFQRDGPGFLIVQNLTHRGYVRSVYGSLDRMAARFAKVSHESLRLEIGRAHV